MSYTRQSKMYKLTRYLPQQSVSFLDCCGKSLRYVVNLYILLCLCDVEHSFVFHKPTLTRIYIYIYAES